MQDRTHKSASQSGNLENQKQTNKHFRNITSYQMHYSCRRKHCFWNCLRYHHCSPIILSKPIILLIIISIFLAMRKCLGYLFYLLLIFCPEDVSSRRHLTFLATNLAHFFLQDILFSKLLLFVAHCIFSIQQTTPSPRVTMLYCAVLRPTFCASFFWVLGSLQSCKFLAGFLPGSETAPLLPGFRQLVS